MKRAQSIAARVGVIVAIAVVGVALTRQDPKTSSEPGVIKPARVETGAVSSHAHARDVSLTGTLRSGETATLGFQVGGRVNTRKVVVGERVEKGQRLLDLDAKPLRHARDAAAAEVSRLEAQLAQARRDSDRASSLERSAVVTAEQAERARSGVDQLIGAVDATRVRLAEARRQLSETTLKAPFSGTVLALHTERGESVAPGSPVITLAGDSGLEAQLDLPERYIGAVSLGATLTLAFPQRPGAQPVTGTVTSIGRASLGGGHQLFPVIVSIPERADVLPGMTVRAELTLPGDTSLTVPADAVSAPTGSTTNVYVVRDGRVTRVPVTVLGFTNGGDLRVEGSLSEGERVVTSGHVTLVNGQQIEGVTR